MITKGAVFEELVREYFARQNFFVLRAVAYRYAGDDVTDVDVWLYGRQAASARVRIVVDVKNKKSPKAFERVLWVKGLQMSLACDRAIVATTDKNPALENFAHSQNVNVLSKSFLDGLGPRLIAENRLTLEEFVEQIQLNPNCKQDGDWLRVLSDAKSAIVSISGFPAFNKAMLAFRFFAGRTEVRQQHREQALRCTIFCAALACIALDSALQKFVYEDADRRFHAMIDGINYGDNGDGRVKQSLESALNVVTEGMQNGRAIAGQARQKLTERLTEVRADIIAEYFALEQNAHPLFMVAREMEAYAHADSPISDLTLSVQTRSVLGVFADYSGIKRSALPVGKTSDVKDTPELTQGKQITKSNPTETDSLPTGGLQRPLL